MHRFPSQRHGRPDSPSATYPPRNVTPVPLRGNYAPSVSSCSNSSDALTHSTPCPPSIPRAAQDHGSSRDVLDTPCEATPRAADVALTLEEQLMLLGLHPEGGTAAWFVSLWHIQQWADDAFGTEDDTPHRIAEIAGAASAEEDKNIIVDEVTTGAAAPSRSADNHPSVSPTPSRHACDEADQAEVDKAAAANVTRQQRRLSSSGSRGDSAMRGQRQQKQQQHSARSQSRTAPAMRLTPVDLTGSAPHGQRASSHLASSTASSSPPLPSAELSSEPRRRRQARQTLAPLPDVPSAATAPAEADHGAEDDPRHEDAARSTSHAQQRLLGPLTSARGVAATLADGRRTVVVISLGSISELRQKVISERIAQATRHTTPAAGGAEAALLGRPAHYFDVGSLVRARGRQQRLPPLRTVPLR